MLTENLNLQLNFQYNQLTFVNLKEINAVEGLRCHSLDKFFGRPLTIMKEACQTKALQTFLEQDVCLFHIYKVLEICKNFLEKMSHQTSKPGYMLLPSFLNIASNSQINYIFLNHPKNYGMTAYYFYFLGMPAHSLLNFFQTLLLTLTVLF